MSKMEEDNGKNNRETERTNFTRKSKEWQGLRRNKKSQQVELKKDNAAKLGARLAGWRPSRSETVGEIKFART